MKKFLLFLASLIAFAGCGGADERAATPFTLPNGWYQSPENDGAVRKPVIPPPPNVADGVRTVFETQAASMSALNKPNQQSTWSLAAVSAGFGISGSGVFGFLTDGGGISVGTTWVPLPNPPHKLDLVATQKPKSKPTAVVLSATTADDILRQLTPAIRAAVASGKINNEAKLRKNLKISGTNFITLCRALEAIPNTNNWKAQSFSLSLSFNASGEVMPGVGLGGGLDIGFSWNKSMKPGKLGPTTPLSHDLALLVDVIAQEIPIAIAESKSMKKAGFALSRLNVGVDVSLSGSIGVIQAGVGAGAGLMFIPTHPDALASNDKPPEGYLSLIDPVPSDRRLTFAATRGIDYRIEPESGTAVYQVPVDSFKQGLTDAIDMAVYFAEQADSQPVPGWILVDLSASFNLSLSGSMTFATVGVSGNIGMGLRRVKA